MTRYLAEVSRNFLFLTALLIVLLSETAQAGIIQYELKFFADSGPMGTGGFTFENCADLSACPNFVFEASFGSEPSLVFDIVHLGGTAESLLGFFQGDPTSSSFPATNFASLDGLNLLSFESDGPGDSSGVYCLRLSAGASGLCSEDSGVFAAGRWSAEQVPEPSTLGLLGAGLLGLFMRRMRVA